MRRVLAPLVAVAVLAEPAAQGPDRCARAQLTTRYPGVFTVATDQPVYPP